MAPASIMHCLSQTNQRVELLISPLIQFRLAITTSAIPSSAPATPNPGAPWDGGWSVDEWSAAVRVGDAAQYISPLRAWIQQPTACARLFCVQAAAWGKGGYCRRRV